MMRQVEAALLLSVLLLSVGLVVMGKEEEGAKERFGGNSLNALINDRIQEVAKRCLINLRGVECPDNRRFMQESLIIAGLGYDRFTHDIKPQILKSNNAQSYGSPRVENFFSSMNSAREFYSMIYPSNPNNVFYNGLYAHNGNADQMFTRFFSGSFNVANAQKQYLTHNARVQSENAITEEFSRIVDLLPEYYDDAIYNMMINYFGDSVLTSVEYGGVVDSTISVRSCFSDGNMAKYVQTELSNIVGNPDEKVPLGYAQYHKVSQLDIAGGNPQDDNIPRRIQSFPSNPVPIRFVSSPIWTVFPPELFNSFINNQLSIGAKRENMKNAYNNYVNSKNNMVNDMVARLNYLRDLEAFAPTPFFAYTKKGAIHSDFGRGEVYGNNQANIGEIKYVYYGKKLVQAQGRATVRIFRQRDDSFYVQLDTRCDATNNFPGFEPVIINSPATKNACVTINLPAIYAKKIDGELVLGYSFPADNVIVCNGCTPTLKIANIILECPANPAKPCPIVQNV